MKKFEELKTFEDACRIAGKSPVIVSLSGPAEYLKPLAAQFKLIIIVSAANRLANDGKEWVPDFTNSQQRKYEPIFYRGSSGFRFRGYGDWGAATGCGSRLCFISSEAAKYVATQFEDLYNDFLN